MNITLRTSALALAVSAGWAMPAHAADAASVQEELAAMRAQMQAMAQRIDTLEGELAEANAKADTASQAAQVAAQTATEAKATAEKAPPVQVAFKGAPEFSGEGGWRFKPRGRVQLDAGGINAPSGLSGSGNDRLGVGTELRRAWIGFEGAMPGGVGYRVDVSVGGSSVSLADAFVSYKAGRHVTLKLGNQKPFTGLEDLTANLYTSFTERSAVSEAFGFERRLGLSAQYTSGDVIVQGGVFSDNLSTISADTAKVWSVDGRVVFAPKLGSSTLHLGGSAHYKELGGSVVSSRYRARPFLHSTDLRLVDTGTLAADSETQLMLEGAWISGRFHASAESRWMKVSRPGVANSTFTGGYGEVGYLLTDDTTAYSGGVFKRIKPRHGLDKGGMGAVQVNARYDWVDLVDGGIMGGRQKTAGLSLVWIPVSNLRLLVNYGHSWVDDAAVTADGDGSYGIDSMGMRAQIDF
ncbi:OprO/OprP family phosphate-selective porin [Novosphingobium beihaiensis]|uniref:Porin n=1 Tax=Novosphingobium beihaiensis TaxID=2930389 RepID=A0ABT0BKK0_9SPHN|nr:porin [Novosphingobium beihaiensis]MCJ2185591.1 porin [Novosphingobium beihaiensis]